MKNAQQRSCSVRSHWSESRLNINKAQLPRKFTSLSILNLAFIILNFWNVLSTSLSLSSSSGEPSAAVWGLLVVNIENLSLAISLIEFLSAYLTVGGQYHWVVIVSPSIYAPFLAWLTKWITLFEWIAVIVSKNLLSSQLIVRLVMSKKMNEVDNLSNFFMYLIITWIAFVVNFWLSSRLPSLNKFALFASIIEVVIIFIITLTYSRFRWAKPSFVFAKFVNETSWPGQYKQILLQNILLDRNWFEQMKLLGFLEPFRQDLRSTIMMQSLTCRKWPHYSIYSIMF